MLRIIIFAFLALNAVCAQEAAEQSSAPEPYAYSYQTDSHSASEQRSADGKVTGYYTLIDPTDGRERRVEYTADETGFHAKVATNELGTKQENSADVEMQASPPTEAQLAYQSSQQYKQQQYSTVSQQYQQPQQQVAYSVQQQTPAVLQNGQTVYYSQQQQQQPGAVYGGYGYSSGYGYNPGYAYQQGYYGGQSYQMPPVGYYSNYQGSRVATARGSSVQPAVSPYFAGGSNSVTKYSSSVSTVPASGTSYSYSSGPVVTGTTSTRTVTTSGSGAQAPGNLMLLKKK